MGKATKFDIFFKEAMFDRYYYLVSKWWNIKYDIQD